MRAETQTLYELFMPEAGEQDRAHMTKEQAQRANEKLRREGRQSCWLLCANTDNEQEQQSNKKTRHANATQ